MIEVEKMDDSLVAALRARFGFAPDIAQDLVDFVDDYRARMEVTDAFYTRQCKCGYRTNNRQIEEMVLRACPQCDRVWPENLQPYESGT